MTDVTGYSGEERRTTSPPRMPLSEAIAQVVGLQTDVERLAEAVEGSKQTERRFRWTLGGLGLMFMLQIAALGFLVGVGQDAKNSADTLNSCLIPGGECYKNLAQRGIQGSVRQLRFNYCAFSIVPDARTEQNMDQCVVAAYPDVEDILGLVKGGK